jgi:molybdenum cofactor synthesis domain-containing protein
MLPEIFKVLIITLSDRASKGEYEDQSGPKVKEMVSGCLDTAGWEYSIELVIIPDDAEVLAQLITQARASKNLIITTGGTGIGPRDITVDTVKPMLSKEIPGIMDFIRIKYGADKPNVLLSRSIAGITGESLIYTLPGSPRAVEEYMSEIVKTLVHTVRMQYGSDVHT